MEPKKEIVNSNLTEQENQVSSSPVVEEAVDYVFNLFKRELDEHILYHSFNHTYDTAQAAELIGKGVGLSPEDLETVLLAAWFHDTGFTRQYENNESVAAELAAEFLAKRGWAKERIQSVQDCIMATCMPQQPENILQEVICDADLSNLGSKDYFEKGELLRVEWESCCNKTFTELEWLQLEIDFLKKHRYHTRFAHVNFSQQKNSNIATLNRQLQKESRRSKELLEKLSLKQKDVKHKQRKAETPERGIETMFRVALRNHINLSAIADNKANIMLTVNAVIISISLSTLVPGIGENPKLIWPTIVLLSMCLTTIVFATLSTRPKVTEGTFTRQDIEERKSNLLFFGNFFNMPLEEYDWGMREMMKDRDFLYGSMIKDFYFLGQVLGKKYKYLRMCYTVFMIGLFVSVLSFGYVFLF